jgi:hypothetical protein
VRLLLVGLPCKLLLLLRLLLGAATASMAAGAVHSAAAADADRAVACAELLLATAGTRGAWQAAVCSFVSMLET